MLSTRILWISVLIPLSTANRGVTNCKGDDTKLSCLDPENQTDDRLGVNVLWKKLSGERVIWKYNGDRKKGDTFMNRTVELNEDLSLTIDGCDRSDQGTYILCINGKPKCKVMLFIRDSTLCKPKTTTEQSSTAKQGPTDEKHPQTETSLPNTYVRWVIYTCLCLVVLVVFLFICVIHTYISKEEKTKNEKSGSKLLHTEIQRNYADV